MISATRIVFSLVMSAVICFLMFAGLATLRRSAVQNAATTALTIRRLERPPERTVPEKKIVEPEKPPKPVVERVSRASDEPKKSTPAPRPRQQSEARRVQTSPMPRILPTLSLNLSDGGGIGFDILLPPGDSAPPQPDDSASNRASQSLDHNRLFRIDEVDRQPVRSRYVQPRYPRTARRRGISGTVTIEFTVDAEGIVKDAQLSSNDGDESLADAALEAVRQWRFRPAVRDGKSVAVRLKQPVRFTLDF